MSSIGPQLPPQLSKRKRSPSDTERPSPSKTTRPSNNNNDDGSDSDDGYGPSAPKAAGPTMPPNVPSTRPSIGPAMPPSSTHPTGDDSPTVDDTAAAAPAPPASPRKKRTHGPAPPPAPLFERPPTSPPPHSAADSDSDSDDSDSYGPALPTARTRKPIGPSMPPPPSAEPERLQRDDWMLLPPTASAGYQERDPTKIKSRKFASGMTATTRPKDGGGIASIWTETPQEKAKRLADAVLGRAPADGDRAGMTTTATTTASGGKSGVSGIGSGRDDRIRAFTEQSRGRSLVEEHQAAKKAGAGARKGGVEAEEEDDDPSKRAFDREKDMAVGGKITASQRKELLNRASDFGGRFSKGNYL